MDILVIGGGGREHAICWSLAKSPKAGKLYCAPGNAGIGQVAELVPIQVHEFDKLAAFAEENGVGLVVVGPDDPLADGIVDVFETKNIPVFGPRKNAAHIEGSKTFMKDLLKKYGIPTAAYEKFDSYEPALAYLRSRPVPIVIKADGLAAGKGVTVAFTREQAEAALKDIMVEKVFGESGSQVVIEEFLEGQEMSILSFVDGETVRPMAAAQDHKQVYDGDKGQNTGGMGTYSPLPHIASGIIEEAVETIIKPTAKAMVAEGRPFRGVLFAGLMITPDGKPKTIEFNARFGDPETQVVLPRLKSDLLDIFLAAVNGTLDQAEIEWSDEAAVCVVLASGGYPASYPKGLPIAGLDEVREALVFHAGTARNEAGEWVTNGGRVLGVVGLGQSIAEARDKAYQAAERITFEGKHNRTDIAAKALV
ncbi:phosphoribosylamine--glycine ligase [Paenibacillus macerans]|uniref:Phosphoribosylamine--glycine ligase n=1 Tax=Paenibacillus macerans TaxID=44252 RepID=A0A090Z5M7_PAEMA|nr:phosphoribosylamine--glycine ligase [Paenibacillus macerans]KFN05653.1 phosphoribosylamine--glycine ligase [Paenibacillus macerans]MCY7559841.1 phosphoribosylamine--glycine ligase [Paenibacillus macerans]MEC0151519.1 phosphoribosylamine--glycine ligase [Paenibacillus macerans]SUA85533.1 phosphoribosylamine--glycine ligase [Paenibacillus macerans]